MSAMEASWWLNERLQAWLGEKNGADTLTQSVPHNVTSEMGLGLLDVADVIRPLSDVVAFLENVDDVLPRRPAQTRGRAEARAAIQAYLDKYGMRCVGEIDITKPRWSGRPTELVPMILANVKNFEPGAGKRRFEQGRQDAWKKEQELLARLRVLPDGERKAEEVKRMIDRVRTFIGVPGVSEVRHGQPLLRLQAGLARGGRAPTRPGILRKKEDIFYLTLQELHDVARTHHVDDELTPPAQGSVQVLPGAHAAPRAHVGRRGHRRALPTQRCPRGRAGRLTRFRGNHRGAGTRDPGYGAGRSRSRRLLVTAYTDPSWTPFLWRSRAW